MPTKRKTWIPRPHDVDIIWRVNTFKLLSSHQIIPFFDGSTRGIQHRLKRLVEEKYLFSLPDRRPHEPAIYTLGNRGLLLMHDRFGVPIPKNPRQPQQARRIKPLFIEHTLEIADTITAIELACRKRPDIRFIAQGEIIAVAPEGSRVRAEAHKLGGRPLYMEARVSYNRRRSVQSTEADHLFGLRFLNEPNSPTAYFFLEQDRGNETIITPKLDKESIIKKQLVYLYASGIVPNTKNIYEAQFGVHSIRTLFVISARHSPGDERVISFLKANVTVYPTGTGLFLFVTRKSFLDAFDALTTPLINGKHVRLTLIG